MRFVDNDAPLEVLNDVPKAARKLGEVSPHTVRAWLRDGKLEKTKVGSRTMVTDRAIREFIERSNQK
jgi:hypothetical protein